MIRRLVGFVVGLLPLRIWLVLGALGLASLFIVIALQRYDAAIGRAQTAETALDKALAENATYEMVNNALWDNAMRLDQQRQSLANQLIEIDAAGTTRHAEIRTIQHDDPTVQPWADSPLPDRVRRLRERPALTGADAYRQWLRDSEPLHAASEQSQH